MSYMFARRCGLIGMVAVLRNATLGAGPQALDATRVRLLRRDNQRMQMIIDHLFRRREHGFMLSNVIHNIRIFWVGSLLLFSASTSATTAEMHMIEAEAGETVGEAFKAADSAASGGYLVSLTKPGQCVRFTGLPAAGKLA